MLTLSWVMKFRRNSARRIAAAQLALLLSVTHAQATAPTHGGVVSVSHPLAAEAGAKMLESGGNAVDAAAAIQFALNVVEPQSSGIGGGCFMMVHLARENSTFIVDCRERAPAAATPTMFKLTGVPTQDLFAVASTSGLAVGVPGTVAGIGTALRQWGNLTLATTLAPAIRLAADGFPVNRFFAGFLASDGGRTSLQPETAAVFRPGGVPLVEGDILVQPDLAKTLRLIADQGPDVFYRGEIAHAIVHAQKRSRTTAAGQIPEEGAGRMTLDDLAQYHIVIRKAVADRYRDWTVVSTPPPSSGGLTLLQMLKILERYPIGDKERGFGFGAPTTTHVMSESMRLAFADRAVWMGDEDFVYVPRKGLLHPGYVSSRADLIDLNHRMEAVTAGNPLPFDSPHRRDTFELGKVLDEEEKGISTTHFSVVDTWGNVVSMTTTIENTWGTGIMVPGFGFLLNNELTDFNLLPTFEPSANPGANDAAPFKRPRSSMAPTMLFQHGNPVVAYGSPGGASIINTVLSVTLNLIDHHMSIQQAIDAPRLSVTSAAGTVSCEGGHDFMQPAYSPDTFSALVALGHVMPTSGTCTSNIGAVQAVVIELHTGRRYGGADQRREGTVICVPAGRRSEIWSPWSPNRSDEAAGWRILGGSLTPSTGGFLATSGSP